MCRGRGCGYRFFFVGQGDTKNLFYFNFFFCVYIKKKEKWTIYNIYTWETYTKEETKGNKRKHSYKKRQTQNI